jgi:hypothetical protein
MCSGCGVLNDLRTPRDNDDRVSPAFSEVGHGLELLVDHRLTAVNPEPRGQLFEQNGEVERPGQWDHRVAEPHVDLQPDPRRSERCVQQLV